MKKRIAIWIHGGIGGGNFSQGQPVIGKLVERLGLDYEIIVYSQLRPNEGFIGSGYTMCSAPRAIKFMGFRWLYLLIIFLYNHIKKQHDLTYAFWGYPAGLIAVFLGKLFRKPSIIHLQGGDAVSIPKFRYGAFYGFFSKKLSCWAYSHASCLIALTLFQANNLNSYGVKAKIEIIPYGPDLTMFKFNSDKFQRRDYRFIHIGNHNPLKDQRTLLKTFSIVAKVYNCRLKLIGHDALQGELKNYSHQLNISDIVEFLEPVPYHEIPYHLSEADVLLHTSLYEGQATVISEAAACGVLLAGTRVGLLADLGENFGLVVNIGDAESLAEKILCVLNDKQRAFTLMDCSRKWVEKHDQQWTLDTIKNRIQNLIHV